MRYTPIQKWNRREKKLSDSGYVLVCVPEHPKAFCGGWYYEHRLFAEKQLNRILPSWVTVHHIDEDKTNNVAENLFVCTRTEHNYAA